MHYFQWNIKAYLAATAHLTNAEDLAYRRLLEHYYDTEQPIPTALPLVSRRLRLGLPELESVLNEFFLLTPDGWINAYCDTVIAEFNAYITKQQANGSLGGRRKKANAKPKEPTAKPPLTQAIANKNQEPITNNQEPNNQNQEPEPSKPKSKPLSASALLAALGIHDQLAADWITLRKTKKAAITKTALDGIQREADKASLSMNAVLRLCCERGWGGFKSEWVLQPSGNGTAADKSKAAKLAAALAWSDGDNGNIIEGESHEIN